jgi:hypothetical protein
MSGYNPLNLAGLPTPRQVATPGTVAGEPRQLTAFIGGLDLTYGRFDTPDHSIFRTLNTSHKHDFHNACFDVAAPIGPREPWHDVAANVTGPVVRDLVASFEERWRRQGRGNSHLVDVANDKELHDGPFAHEDEQWTVQVFRSIDERSALFMRDEERLLETKKGRNVDRSIHHAYVHYTRAAERYIYIEQQYFIGSSNQWLSDNHGDATNLIPYEMALRIAASIHNRQPLRVYVVIPMWPEGVASDATIQKILFFQFKTVEMMYSKIAEAIAEAGLRDAHPTDYLNFFCLGKREVAGPAGAGVGTGPGSAAGASSPASWPTTAPPSPGTVNPTTGESPANGALHPTATAALPPPLRGTPPTSPLPSTPQSSPLRRHHLERLGERPPRAPSVSRWRWSGRGRPRVGGGDGGGGASSRSATTTSVSMNGSESSFPSSAAPPSADGSSRLEAMQFESSSSSDNATFAELGSQGRESTRGGGRFGRVRSRRRNRPPSALSASPSVSDSVQSAPAFEGTVGHSPSSSRMSNKSPRRFSRQFSGLSLTSPASGLVRSDSRRTRVPRAGDEEMLSRTRRHPIYQHAKLFLSDDEVLVTGSANLNERSMAGVRDTEMAIGAFQPRHTLAKARCDADAGGEGGGNTPAARPPLPHGEVARFRRRLWAEHALGASATSFPPELEDPGSLECVRAMREIAHRNWDAYAGDEVVELRSHLLAYPYTISPTGQVTAAVRLFPDTRGPVCGTPNAIIPNILTS